jgi:hypothetical protein
MTLISVVNTLTLMTQTAMNNEIKKCPVCSRPVENDTTEFCPICNWELISIPNNSSKGLKDFYNQKLKLHSEQFLQLTRGKEIITEQVQKIEKISLKINEAEKSITEAKEAKLQLRKSNDENSELISQVKFYQERFGDSWIGNPKETKPTLAIMWEMISSMKFRFYCDNIQSVFPTSIIMLLKKNQRPTADGDFNFALMIDTASKKLIDAKTVELTVSNNELKSGKYFSRFTNLNFNTSNILFFHKEQGNHSTSFDWDKTIINL